MNGFILIVPLIFIRYGLPIFFNKEALVRASHYPSFPKDKEMFLIIYQLSTCLLIIIPFFLKVNLNSICGWSIYTLGIIILVASTINFSKPNNQRLNLNCLYSLSRNPMYVGYFIYFLGCCFITKSVALFIVLIIF